MQPTTQLHTDALPLMERLLEQLVERDEAARQEARAEKAEMRAELAEQRTQVERLQGQLMAPQEVLSAQQIEAVTARLEALHGAQLLSDDELFALEDYIADFYEAFAACGVVTMQTVSTSPAMGKAHRLVALSEGMPKDAMFSRQLRRKFV